MCRYIFRRIRSRCTRCSLSPCMWERQPSSLRRRAYDRARVLFLHMSNIRSACTLHMTHVRELCKSRLPHHTSQCHVRAPEALFVFSKAPRRTRRSKQRCHKFRGRCMWLLYFPQRGHRRCDRLSESSCRRDNNRNKYNTRFRNRYLCRLREKKQPICPCGQPPHRK